MKIRATKKLLNIARIKETKDLSPLMDKMPGEWYSTVNSGHVDHPVRAC